MPERTILHPLGFKAVVDIQPRVVDHGSTARQTIRIKVYKTSESVLGRCYAEGAKKWVTFDGEPEFRRSFDPEGGVRTLWHNRDLPPVTCTVAVADETSVPQQEPETVTVQISARARSDRSADIFGANAAVIDLTVGS